MELFTTLALRKATIADVPAIVGLLAEDVLGQTREIPVSAGDCYYQAFAAITADAHQELLVVEKESQIVATLQLSFIPNMTLQGAWRCQVEGVRVKASQRGEGIGRWLFEQVFARAKNRGCQLVQLTTNSSRLEAVKFYESLGFEASHVGFKRRL